MKKYLVCATDFSPLTIRLADSAAALAKKWNTTLVLAHVCEAVGPEPGSMPFHKTAQDQLAAESNRLRQTGVAVEEQLLTGSADEALLGLCDRLPVRLIIMGSGAKRKLPNRWFDAGTVEGVARHAKVPALVIRDPQVLEGWLEGQRQLRVFIGINLASFTEIPLLWVKELAQIAPCSITVGYLNWIADEALRLGMTNVSLFDESPQLQGMLEVELRDRVSRILEGLVFGIYVQPRGGTSELPLIEMAEFTGADLFVVGNRLRTGISRIFSGPVSVDILRHAPMGVAVVPLLESAVEAPLPNLERVMVPTDFSELANRAIRYACSVVASGGTVHLVHITHLFGLSEAESMIRLRALVPPEAMAMGIDFKTYVFLDENPARGILKLSVHFRSDAICMGAPSSSSGPLGSIFGSTLQRVLADSTLPVFLVRASA